METTTEFERAEFKTTGFKTVILSALLVLLTACGGSSGLYTQSSGDGTDEGIKGLEDQSSADGTSNTDSNAPADETGTAPAADDANTNNTTETNTDAQPPATQTTGVSDQRVQFVTLDCGTLPVADILSSDDRSAPATMAVGQLVIGRIDPDTPYNNEHYWRVEMQPGNYHLVVDSERVDRAWSKLGLIFTDLHDQNVANDLVLLEGDESDYLTRFHAYFTVKVARTMNLRVTPNHDAEDYTFGIFKNGDPVPSPRFQACPEIKTLSVDTTEALILPQEETHLSDRWYQVNLDPTNYTVNSQAARTDGASSKVQYKFIQVDQFGQSERITKMGYIDNPGPTTTGSVPLSRSDAGPVWIRIQNFNCELDMEFTLNLDL